MTNAYLIPLQTAFEQQANTANAVPMEAYMRGQFPFYGIKSPERKQILKQFLASYGLPQSQYLEPIIKEMWVQPEREWQYCAQEILKRSKKLWGANILSLFEWLILEKPWWDTVDFISSHLVGTYLAKEPKSIKSITSDWANSQNIWLIRTAIIFQRGYKGSTDEQLLFQYIRQHYGHKDFFIRKAIGWALREYAKTNPDAVLAFVQAQPLSPLSQKEALRRL